MTEWTDSQTNRQTNSPHIIVRLSFPGMRPRRSLDRLTYFLYVESIIAIYQKDQRHT